MVDIDHARFDRVSSKGREDGKKNWLLARAAHGMAQAVPKRGGNDDKEHRSAEPAGVET